MAAYISQFVENNFNINSFGGTFITGGIVLYFFTQCLAYWSGIRGSTGAFSNFSGTGFNGAALTPSAAIYPNLNSPGILQFVMYLEEVTTNVVKFCIIILAAASIQSTSTQLFLPRNFVKVLTLVIIAFGVRVLLEGMGPIGVLQTRTRANDPTNTCTDKNGLVQFPLANFTGTVNTTSGNSGAYTQTSPSTAQALLVCGAWPLIQNCIYKIATYVTDSALSVNTLFLAVILTGKNFTVVQ